MVFWCVPAYFNPWLQCISVILDRCGPHWTNSGQDKVSVPLIGVSHELNELMMKRPLQCSRPCKYCSAVLTSPRSMMWSSNVLIKPWWLTVSLSQTTAKWRRALVTATFIRRSSARKPTSPKHRHELTIKVFHLTFIHAAKYSHTALYSKKYPPRTHTHTHTTDLIINKC